MREGPKNPQPINQETDHIAFTNRKDAIRFLKNDRKNRKQAKIRPPVFKRTKSPNNPTTNLENPTIIEAASQTYILKILEGLPNKEASISAIRKKMQNLTTLEFERAVSNLFKSKKSFRQTKNKMVVIKLQNGQ